MDINTNILLMLLCFFVSAAVAAFLLPQVLYLCKRYDWYDKPGQRKVHTCKVPRLGGVTFVPSLLIGMIVTITVLNISISQPVTAFSSWTFLFLSGVFLIYLVGIADDIVGVSAFHKFLVQIVCSSFFPLAGLYINNFYGFLGIYELPLFFSTIFTVLVSVTIVNSVNLIDGIDGLAASISIIALLVLGFCFYEQSVFVYTLFAVGMIGSVLPFLYYNLTGNPEKGTKVFMGDTGSLTLGYTLSFMAIKYAMENTFVMDHRDDALLMAYSVLIVPIFDVIRVTLYRMRHHKPIFAPDKSHIHHKMLRAGCSSHMALLGIVLLDLMFVAVNLLVNRWIMDINWIVGIDVALWISFHLFLNWRIRAKEAQSVIDTVTT